MEQGFPNGENQPTPYRKGETGLLEEALLLTATPWPGGEGPREAHVLVRREDARRLASLAEELTEGTFVQTEGPRLKVHFFLEEGEELPQAVTLLRQLAEDEAESPIYAIPDLKTWFSLVKAEREAANRRAGAFQIYHNPLAGDSTWEVLLILKHERGVWLLGSCDGRALQVQLGRAALAAIDRLKAGTPLLGEPERTEVLGELVLAALSPEDMK